MIHSMHCEWQSRLKYESIGEVSVLKNCVIITLALVLTLALLSCSKPESRMIGKWVGNSGSFQFYNNKTGVMNPPEGVRLPGNIPFTWEIQEKDSIMLIIAPPVGKRVSAKLESKNVLVIEDDKFVKQ
ncbi:MAG: hypothetical protein WA140_10580 [Geobacteraceae bacterium]